MTWLQRYSFELYPELEAETGQSCGFHHVGGVMTAFSQAAAVGTALLHMRAGLASANRT